jgi:DNA-directed RNA polymerase II subunit RPB1
MSHSKNWTAEQPSRIIGIQFSVMSPQQILKNSVVEIQTKDTYVNNTTPVLNGLFDPRMGTQEANQRCPTDGHDYFKCPGYFGHMKLARPVFYIQFLNVVYKVLRCVCIKCSKLLIDKNKYRHLLNHRAEVRWNEVYALASKIKRCGEDTDDGCSCKQPTKIKKSDIATLIAEWETKPASGDAEGEGNANANAAPDDDDDADVGASTEASVPASNKVTMKLTADIVLKIFKRISDDDVVFMGFNPVWTRPEWFICEVLAVPPPNVRPSVKNDGVQRAEDDLTMNLVQIFKANEKIASLINSNGNEAAIEQHVQVLQYHVATQIDNKLPGSSFSPVVQRSGRPLKSIKDRLNGKGGRLRQNLMGKRVDFSARSVITADPNISIAELGVPLQIAKNITRPVRVNKQNIAYLTSLVRNGASNYPGAKMIDRKSSNISISLSYVDLNSVELEEGDVVHRHMLDGDYVLFNRQPTLHRMSMMAHKAVVMHHGNSIRMNVAVTQPYNADQPVH